LRLGGSGRGLLEKIGEEGKELSLEGAAIEQAGKDLIIRKEFTNPAM
jgi:hypothetical protein